MVETELIEQEDAYTIHIEDEDILVMITYIDGWYDYQLNMVHKKMENVESDFSEENRNKWKSHSILIPNSSEIYPCFLELLDNFSKGEKAKCVEEYFYGFNENLYKDMYDAENETITWSTDEYRVRETDDNNFQIIKTEDGIKIVFNYINKPVVRVSKSGSRHGDFYIPFTQLFSDLRSTLKSKGKVKTKNKVK